MVISWLGPTMMVLTAVVALGCVLTMRPWRVGPVIASAVMVIAMVDMVLDHVLLTPVSWAGVLVALGVFVVALPRSEHDHAAGQHGLALVAAAVIMILSPHALPAAAIGHADHQSSVHLTGGWVLGLAITVVYAAALLPRERTTARSAAGTTAVGSGQIQLVQVLTTTGCLALMAVGPSLV